MEFCIYQSHINDLQNKIEKIGADISEKTEEMDEIRKSILDYDNEKANIKNRESNLIANMKLLQEKKQNLSLEMSEFQSKENLLHKEANSENLIGVGENKEKLAQSQYKKKIETTNKEISALQQKKLSLQSEVKSIESLIF